MKAPSTLSCLTVAGGLLLISNGLPAQDVQIDEKSMQDAWSDEQPEFESLDNADSYGSDSGGYYGSGGYSDYPDDGYDRPSTGTETYESEWEDDDVESDER
ncbi:hypothetical protein J2T55_000789 [Methylohalomonas lacus]|uniref:Uncharacterized protein n=1 Tax=Methylohalomonas lacus TaxID=398773 RepID=A0AAE3L0X7_9GAMM|nr:hypothetical protein [Methylohalomonas lacus]MCS3902785.1 hypothetical protein [Methylohalomonas lacus]